MDLLDDPNALLPELDTLQALHDFAGIFPISALRQKKLDLLETFVREKLPEGHHLFPEGQTTNRTERFLAAELIREKIIRQLGDELPHTTATEIEAFHTDDRGVLHINAIIFVERDGQKRIVIGTGGSRLRSIGTEARRDMEKAFDCKVMLKLWVKVKSGWSDDIRALRSLGLEGET
jgi:GTP-binding protein Era